VVVGWLQGKGAVVAALCALGGGNVVSASTFRSLPVSAPAVCPIRALLPCGAEDDGPLALALRTHEGMALLFRRLGAIGRFGTSPFLVRCV
jgi:hypothetical protein